MKTQKIELPFHPFDLLHAVSYQDVRRGKNGFGDYLIVGPQIE